MPSAWSFSIFLLSFSRAWALVGAIAVTKRRLPVCGFVPMRRRKCHLPLSSCQRVPVPFSRRGVYFVVICVDLFLLSALFFQGLVAQV